MKKLGQILESNWNDENDSKKKLNPLHEKLIDHYHGFDEYQRNAIESYTDSSRSLNNYHWERHKNPAKEAYSGFENRTQNLDGALHKHRTPHKLTVYSGTQIDPRDMKDEKNMVHHPAYLSTSLNKHSASFFAPLKSLDADGEKYTRHIMKIHVPKGHPGAYVDHISMNQGEREFILPRGTNLKYKGTQSLKDPNGYENEKYYIHEHHFEVMK